MISRNERDALRRVDCRAVAERLLGEPAQQSGQAHHWLCPFHDDRNTPSLAVWPNGWHCFGCQAQGDHYDLVMRIHNVRFAEAHAWLQQFLATDSSSSHPEMHRALRRSALAPARWQAKQAGWRRLADNAIFRLDSQEGSPGQAYLKARSILPETWRAWSLGYVANVQRWSKDKASQWRAEALGPAIMLPWTDGKTIKAVQYRLVEHSQRYHQEAGGNRTLFGAQRIAGRPTLIIVEGELNAVSIWQAAQDLVDVVSFGPEGNVERTGAYLQRLAGHYARVIVWADKPEASRAAEQAVGADRALRSPVDGSSKLDANELLRRAQLRAFIVELLRRLEGDELAQRRLSNSARSCTADALPGSAGLASWF